MRFLTAKKYTAAPKAHQTSNAIMDGVFRALGEKGKNKSAIKNKLPKMPKSAMKSIFPNSRRLIKKAMRLTYKNAMVMPTDVISTTKSKALRPKNGITQEIAAMQKMIL